MMKDIKENFGKIQEYKYDDKYFGLNNTISQNKGG